MKIEYENIVEQMDNKHIKEMLELTFSKILPNMIDGCKNEKQAADIMISLQELLINLKKEGCNNLRFENYLIAEIFPDYCKDLVGVMDSLPISHKEKTFEIFDVVLVNTILGLIIKGLNNGSISDEDMMVPDDEDEDYDVEVYDDTTSSDSLHSIIEPDFDAMEREIDELLAQCDELIDEDDE